jgi:ATP-dependent protease ClpP protease subunit
MTRELAIYQDIDAAAGFGPEKLRSFLTQAGGQPVTIRLNSQGGNVVDGLACYNLLRQYTGKVTVTVDGMALSIASVIAMAADDLVVPDNAWMMIHNPNNQVAGDGDTLRSMAGLLDGMRDQLAEIYSARSKKSVAEIRKLMAAETWFTGRQAVQAGFADRTSAPLAVAAQVDVRRFRNAPTAKHATTFEGAVQLAMARGLSRAKAVRQVSIERPDLHRAYLQAANADRPHVLARIR